METFLKMLILTISKKCGNIAIQGCFHIFKISNKIKSGLLKCGNISEKMGHFGNFPTLGRKHLILYLCFVFIFCLGLYGKLQNVETSLHKDVSTFFSLGFWKEKLSGV